MDEIDITIYLNNFKKFFNQNPGELKNLIGQADKERFFEEVERIVKNNAKISNEFEITQKQIIDVIVMLNDFQAYQLRKSNMETKFGSIFLN